jgi:inner membrane protease subunit 1
MAPPRLDFRRAAFYSKISLQLLCAAHLVSTHIIWSSPASGPSMLPTFELSGEHILTNGYYRRGRGVAVGDLVTYKIPIFVNEMGVKRVIGMPGDYVVAGMPGKTDMMVQV